MDISYESRQDSEGNADAENASRKPSASSGSASRVRRRNRMITSCLECRRRKLKCDRLHPCTNCSKGGRDCVFLAPSLDSATRLKLAELKERMGTLERSLEKEVTQTPGVTQPTEAESHVGTKTSGSESPALSPEEEYSLQPTRLALMDAVYDDEADDVMVDLGIQLGQMRVTDRLGGFVRPRLADEVAATIQLKSQNLFGQGLPKKDDDSEVSKLLELAHQGVQLSFLEPGPSFIAPRSDMLLGSSAQDYSLLDILPTRAAADKLIQQYWLACHPIARIMHRQTFEIRYQLLWDNIAQGIEPPPSVQAIVFATLFTAAVSMTAPNVLNTFGVDQRSLIENFQLGTESSLGKAHFLRSTKTETLQAFVMYLIPMCRDTISRAHSALVGTAVRLAECMGLHRDPSEYNSGPVETQIRRLIWYQLCFLDLRTAEVQGPRVTIRSEDFSTKLPLNINDADLAAGRREESKEWTDMTFARMRFECQEIIREVFFDRILIEQKKMTVTHAVGKVEASRKAMYERYGPIFNKPDLTPLQRTTAVTMSFMLHRLHIVLLHKFYNNWASKTPDRIVQLIVNTGAQQLEDAVTLETSPELQPWRWYSRAYHNFHTAFLLLVDVSINPLRREADRIWRSLDYVYEFKEEFQPQNLTRAQIIEHRCKKAHWIMCQLRDRMRVYRTLRRIKTSADVDDIVLTELAASSNKTNEAKPQADESLTGFNLTSHTLLPSYRPALQSLTRQAQSPYTHVESFASVPASYPISESNSSHNMGSTQETTSPGPKIEPSIGSIHDFSRLQSAWPPSALNASAGTVPLGSMSNETTTPSSEDLQMPEVDWTEWDKMFPPHLNDGNINLPPQTLSGTMQLDVNTNAMYLFPYPSFTSYQSGG